MNNLTLTAIDALSLIAVQSLVRNTEAKALSVHKTTYGVIFSVLKSRILGELRVFLKVENGRWAL